jgi:hypothetical protein
MTTVVLGAITLVAAVTLLGVLWSIVRALRDESASARLRREGVRATGTVVDNTMTSTPQRRLVFSPVVEFRSMSGQQVSAPAQQTAATSWPRGATVEVIYDPADPGRFVLAGAPSRGHLVANTIVGLLVVGILVGTIVVMHRVWSQFRYDQGTTQPTSTQSTGMQPEGGGPWHATVG